MPARKADAEALELGEEDGRPRRSGRRRQAVPTTDDDEDVEAHLSNIYSVTNELLDQLHESFSSKMKVTQRSEADRAMKDGWQRASEESRRCWLRNHPDHPGFDDA